MAVITKTVGTASRQYSTLATALASVPANLVTDGNSYVLLCYNDSEFTSSGQVLNVSGFTTDATHTLTIQCATGQSWSDNASAQTNLVSYNASNGVGLRSTGAYTEAVVCSVANVFWIGLQFSNAANGRRVFDNSLAGSLTDQTMQNCIVDRAAASSGTIEAMRWRCGLATNNFVIQRAAGDGVSFDYVGTARFVNGDVVRPSDKTVGGNAFTALSGSTTLIENSAGFGFTNFANSNAHFTGSNNCSDVAIGFGTSNQASKTFTAQFANTLNATSDFKAKSGADLLDNAVTDTTNIPSATDAVGTSRPQGTAWDIGAWELKASGTNVSITGASATGSAGTVSVALSPNIAITGAQATSSPGSVTAKVSSALTGVQATSSPGTVGIALSPNIAITGVQATSNAGTVTTSSAASPAITGVSGTGAAGTVSVALSPNVAITGASATGAAGTVVVSTGANVNQPITGVSATASAGTLVESIAVPLTGVQATAVTGALGVATSESVAIVGVQGTTQVGSVANTVVRPLLGVQATAAPGVVGFHIDSNVSLLGVSAIGYAGTVVAGGGAIGPCTMLVNDFSFYNMAVNDAPVWDMNIGEIS